MSVEAYPMSIDEYASLEEGVMKKPKGRAFLREYARRHRVAGADDVLEGLSEIRELLAKQKEPEQVTILRAELEEMSAAIAQTRREIRALRPEEGSSNRIMAATEELDAIVTATERATSDILGHAEQLQEISSKLREKDADTDLCDAISTHVTEVFLACSFQDITGQRTTKVVNILRYLEQRVNSMIEVWGTDDSKKGSGSSTPAGTDGPREAHLLEGPQLPGEGIGQDRIDEMLKDEGIDEGSVGSPEGAPAEDEEIGEADLEAVFGPDSEAAA